MPINIRCAVQHDVSDYFVFLACYRHAFWSSCSQGCSPSRLASPGKKPAYQVVAGCRSHLASLVQWPKINHAGSSLWRCIRLLHRRFSPCSCPGRYPAAMSVHSASSPPAFTLWLSWPVSCCDELAFSDLLRPHSAGACNGQEFRWKHNDRHAHTDMKISWATHN